MSSALTHDAVTELLGAYALDAVDDDEAAAIEDHLRDCARCRADLAALRETATQLAHESAEPPPGLWDRVAASLEAAPPPLELAPIIRSRRGWPGPNSVRWLAAAAAVAVIALGGVVIHQQRQLDNVEGALRDQQRGALDSVALRAFDSRGARYATLLSADGSTQVRAVVLNDGSGYLLSQQLPSLGTDRTYQLWAIVDGEPVSAGVLGPRPMVVAFHVDQRVAALAVTEENAGGVTRSAVAPLVSGRLSV